MKIITLLLDFIFPPRPTQTLINDAFNRKLDLPFQIGKYEDINFCARYTNPLVAASIRENKFFHNERAAKLLSACLTKFLEKHKEKMIIIPIPLSKERLKERGHNQVETIALHTKHEVRSELLEKILHTPPQTSLNRKSRLRNLEKAFVCKKPKELEALQNCMIILLDDVVTTGATLKAARASLAPHIHPTSTLICVALAH